MRMGTLILLLHNEELVVEVLEAVQTVCVVRK